jgi:hypothetical protein
MGRRFLIVHSRRHEFDAKNFRDFTDRNYWVLKIKRASGFLDLSNFLFQNMQIKKQQRIESLSLS